MSAELADGERATIAEMRIVSWTALAIAVGAVAGSIDAFWPRCETFAFPRLAPPETTCTNHVVFALLLLIGGLFAGTAALRALSAGRD